MAAVPMSEVGYAQQVTIDGFWTQLDEEQTPELQWPRSVQVYEAMRSQDAQVASVLRAVCLPVRRTPWRIDPAGARDEVVRLVAEDLGLPIVGDSDQTPPPRTRDRFSWPDHLRMALLMLPFGHMFFEQVYRIDANGQARLRKLAPRMPRTIEEVKVAEDGGLIGVQQYSARIGRLQPLIPVNRLVAYVHEREGGNWLGRSLLRPAYKHWLIKDKLLRVDAQMLERNGMGIPLYKGAEGEDNDLSEGLEMARKWRSGDTSGSAIKHGADLQLVGVSGSLPQALPSVRYHDDQTGRAVLAHFLNLGSQTGSWALGTTFADFFTLGLQTLATQIADVATQHIVEDLVDVNWGESEPAPRVVFDEIGSRQAATAQSLKMLLDAGLIFADRRTEEFLRQQYGLPPKEPRPGTDTPPSEDQ